MPNHCDNELTVSGPADVLARFREYAKHEDSILSQEPFIPYPQKFRDMDAVAKKARDEAMAKIDRGEVEKVDWNTIPRDGFNSGGYEWCCQSWGTKWGIYDARVLKESEKSVTYQFLSAWSPPKPVIEAMARQFTKLKFHHRYYECGAAYKGYAKYARGERIDSMEGEYHGDRGG